jgi:hypothetical protein
LKDNRPDGPKIGAQIPVARITLAKAAIWGDSRDCEISKIPGFDRYAARLLAGCLFLGLQKLRCWWWCGAIRPRNVKSCRDSTNQSSGNFRVISDAYAGMKAVGLGGWEKDAEAEGSDGARIAPAMAVAAACVVAGLRGQKRAALRPPGRQ